MRKVIVQLVTSDGTGDTLHRMAWPARQLAKQSPEWLVINLEATATERFSWGENADLLIAFQSNDFDLLRTFRRRRERGLKTLIEFNDNFYAPPSASPAYSEWRSIPLQCAYEELMVAADGIITTSQPLADLFHSKSGKPCHILKNHLPFTPEPLEELIGRKSGEFSLCWAGSIGHAADLIAVVPTIRGFMKDNPAALLHAMGNTALPAVIKIPEEQFRFRPWGDMNEYFSFLANAHVGIVPLINTPYNTCRSDIKAIEMTGRGVLPLLPPAPPYDDFLKATKIPSWESFSELRNLMEMYYRDKVRWRQDLERCYSYVTSERIGEVNTVRQAVYSQYLPVMNEQSAVAWPQESGFLALSGSGSLGALWPDVEKSIRAQLKRGEFEPGLRLIEKSLLDFDGNPNFALGCIAALCDNAAFSDAAALREKCSKRYPRDFRFRTALLKSARSVEEKLTAWSEVLTAAETWNEGESLSWRNHLVSLWRAEPLGGDLLEIGVRLIHLFPDDLSLKALGAMQAAERADENCSYLCSDLAIRYRQLNENREFLEGYTEGYWLSFEQGTACARQGRLGWKS